MITWMQKHKKWLVITIWISTIAFVGAGFVGWGSYDYGSKGGVVAKVGDKEITVEEYQQEYSNLYNQYAQIFGATFNKELAEQLRLKDTAYSQLLQKSILLAYGESLGLIVTDEEIAKEIVKYEEFKVDGVFNKDKYVSVLNQSRMSPKEFENSLINSILFQKIQSIFNVEPSNTEIENIGKLLFLEDDISYKVISTEDITVDINEDDMKNFYEKNKNSYLSKPSYELEIKELDLISSNSSEDEILSHFEKFKSDYKFEDGKIKSFEEAKAEVIQDLDESFTRKEALALYLKLKKEEESFDKKVVYEDDKLPFTDENIQRVKETRVNDITRPFIENNKFMIVKIVKINPASILEFEATKTKVLEDYTNDLKLKKLDEVAQNELKDFKGIELKSINRTSTSRFNELNEKEAMEFLNRLFASDSKESYIKIGNKAILFKVIDSRLLNFDTKNSSLVKDEIQQVIENDLYTNILKKLETSFTIKTFIQTKE